MPVEPILAPFLPRTCALDEALRPHNEGIGVGFPAALQLALDSPGGDFVILADSATAEEKLARSCWE